MFFYTDPSAELQVAQARIKELEAHLLTQKAEVILEPKGCYPRGGHLGIFWVGMCRPGLQIGTPF